MTWCLFSNFLFLQAPHEAPGPWPAGLLRSKASFPRQIGICEVKTVRIFALELNNDIKGIERRKAYIETLIKQFPTPDLVVLPELALPKYESSYSCCLWTFQQLYPQLFFHTIGTLMYFAGC